MSSKSVSPTTIPTQTTTTSSTDFSTKSTVFTSNKTNLLLEKDFENNVYSQNEQSGMAIIQELNGNFKFICYLFKKTSI